MKYLTYVFYVPYVVQDLMIQWFNDIIKGKAHKFRIFTKCYIIATIDNIHSTLHF